MFLFDATVERGYVYSPHYDAPQPVHTLTAFSTILDFSVGEDRVRLVGLGLSASDVRARFSDYTSSLPGVPSGVRAQFSGSDFVGVASGSSVEVTIAGISASQLSVSLFVVSST